MLPLRERNYMAVRKYRRKESGTRVNKRADIDHIALGKARVAADPLRLWVSPPAPLADTVCEIQHD